MATVRKFLADLSGQSEARELAKKEAAQLVKSATLKLDALESQLKDLFRNRELEGAAVPDGAALDGILAATVSKETAYANSLCA